MSGFWFSSFWRVLTGWVEFNWYVGEVNPAFIRALVNAVIESSIDHPVLKLDASVVRQRRKCLRYHTLCFDRLFEFSLVVTIFHRYHSSFAVFITFHRALPYTEPSPVRNLKVLDRVFFRPLMDNGFSHFVNLLFPNLPDMLEIRPRTFQHTRESGRKRDQPSVETVGDILVAMVSIFSLFFDFRLPVHSMRTITTTERSN